MPTQTLGKVKLTPRGAYDPAATYVPLDIVSYGGGSYCVLKNVTGVTPTGDDVNYQLLAESGADGKSPQISASKTWLVWDADAGEYVDTGVSAAGEKGDEGGPGKAPIIGSNGNWYEWDETAGAYTDTGKPSRGEKGDPGATGKSAYQYAQEGGYTGTEAEFSAKLAKEIPEIDKTLTQEGAAADAKATGDSISALTEEIANKSANVYIGDTQPTDGTLYWFDTSDSGSSGGETVTHTVTYELTNVTIDNTAESVNDGKSFAAALAASAGYELSSVNITMGGADITNTAYASGNIYISAVTGDVVITAVAVEVSVEVTTYTVTNNLVNATSNNSAVSVEKNSAYTATLTADDGYVLNTVTVTMGGVDVTSDVYADGVITIPAVTGDVVITVMAIAPNPNLLESNIYGEYSASFSLSVSDLEALNREKLYMVLYSNSPYNTSLSARTYSSISYGQEYLPGTWKTAEYTYTDVVQNAEYTNSRVYEMTIANLRADIQTLIDAGTIKETDGKTVQFTFGPSVKIVKVLYTYDVSQSV